MTHAPQEKDENGMSSADVAEYIENQNSHERRGNYSARPILLQKLNEFGSPKLAVLTLENEQTLTIAGVHPLQPEDEVVLYDDHAPDGPQAFYGVVEQIRDAYRPKDSLKGMRLFYIQKKELGEAHSTSPE